MSIITRGALGYLAVMGVVVGVWAGAFPLAFYRHFPGFGRVWVAVDGPFNEHLVRDAGAAFLMLGALAATGLFRPALARPAAVGFATLCFNLPHFAYHLSHLGMFSPLDQALNVATLLSAVACSGWLLLPAARDRASR